MDKRKQRLRRCLRTRHHIRRLGVSRLSVYKTSQHIYATVYTPTGDVVIATASSLDKELKPTLTVGGNAVAAKAVGKLLAERALAKGVKQVAFDKSGYKYHGRVKALADAARESGMEF